MKKFLLATIALLSLGLVSCNVEDVFNIVLLYNSTWKGSTPAIDGTTEFTLFLGMDKTAAWTSEFKKENPEANSELLLSGSWTNDKNVLTITLSKVEEGHLSQPLPITITATVNGNEMTLEEYDINLTREISYPK